MDVTGLVLGKAVACDILVTPLQSSFGVLLECVAYSTIILGFRQLRLILVENRYCDGEYGGKRDPS